MHAKLITDKLEARAVTYYSYSVSNLSTYYQDIDYLRKYNRLGYNCSIWYMDRCSLTTHSSSIAIHNGNAMQSTLYTYVAMLSTCIKYHHA